MQAAHLPSRLGAELFARGDAFFANYSGHSRWAETNGIVLLFPQTYPDPAVNPGGAWDWEGTYDEQFDQKGGVQTSAIMAMVARITSGYQGPAKAIEYHHAGFDHYFVTSDPDEISKLDSGFFTGWVRTGESFAVAPVNTSGASNVCRFFSTSFGAKSSHFYTADASECETVKRNPDWQFEGLVFALNAPDAAGNCAAGAQPLYPAVQRWAGRCAKPSLHDEPRDPCGDDERGMDPRRREGLHAALTADPGGRLDSLR